jgi:hypothetical protein
MRGGKLTYGGIAILAILVFTYLALAVRNGQIRTELKGSITVTHSLKSGNRSPIEAADCPTKSAKIKRQIETFET